MRDDNLKTLSAVTVEQKINELFEAAKKGTALCEPALGIFCDSWDDRLGDRLGRLACAALAAQVIARDKTFFARYRQSLINSGVPMNETRRVFGY